MYELGDLRHAVAEAGYTILSEAEDFRGTPVSSNALKWVVRLKPS